MFLKIKMIIIGIVICLFCWQQYSFYKKLSSVQSELISTSKQFSDFKDDNTRKQIEIVSAISDSNIKLQKELNDEIGKINNVVDDNSKRVISMRATTDSFEANYDNFTETTRKNYITTINKLFGESADLLVEIGKNADVCVATSIMYQDMLEDQYNIVNKANQDVIDIKGK